MNPTERVSQLQGSASRNPAYGRGSKETRLLTLPGLRTQNGLTSAAKLQQRSDRSKNARSLPGFDNFGGACGHRLGAEWQEVFNMESLSPLIVTVPVSPHVDQQLISKHCQNQGLRFEIDYFEGGSKQVTGSLYQVDQFAKQVYSDLNAVEIEEGELEGILPTCTSSSSSTVSRPGNPIWHSDHQERDERSSKPVTGAISGESQPSKDFCSKQTAQESQQQPMDLSSTSAALSSERQRSESLRDQSHGNPTSVEKENAAAAAVALSPEQQLQSLRDQSHDNPTSVEKGNAAAALPSATAAAAASDSSDATADSFTGSEIGMSSEPQASHFQINKVTFDYLRRILTDDLEKCLRKFKVEVDASDTNCEAGAVRVFVKPAQGMKVPPDQLNEAFEAIRAQCQKISQLNMEEEKVNFPSIFYNKVNTAIQKNLLIPRSLRVLIDVACKSSLGVISLVGAKQDLETAYKRVNVFVDSLKSSRMPPATPGQAVFISGGPVQLASRDSESEGTKKPLPCISVKKGSITKEKVDVIVCSNDRYLSFSSGTASAIRKAAGRELEVECQKFLQSHGGEFVRPGQVVRTKSGSLPCHYVFHAVIEIPETAAAATSEPSVPLTEIFFECLDNTAVVNAKSIAVPALGCGFLKLDKRDCIKTLLKTVDKYWDIMGATSMLQEIVFVDTQDAAVKEFRKQLDERKKGLQKAHSPPASAVGSQGKGAGGKGGSKAEKRQSSSDSSRGKVNSGSQPSSAEAEKDEKSATAAAVAQAAGARKTSDGKGEDAGGVATEEEDTACAICFASVASKTLSCGHKFCKECIDLWFKEKPVCPTCGAVLGKLTGTQPRGGTMNVSTLSSRLAGYHCGTIQISYYIPPGTQTEKHPHPGKKHGSLSRTAYLPDNKEGREVLRLLKEAFDARLTFTVGTSRTTGADDQVTWNDIHHKTSTHGGPQSFGYPDPGYLARVKDELKAKGIE